MIPLKVRKKADRVLGEYLKGEKAARKPTDAPFLSLVVTHRYRLLCRHASESKDPASWELLAHEKYSKITKQRGVKNVR